MTVVRNEFERGENMPGVLLYQRLLATAYEWHNYGKVTIGNRSDIERVPIERLKAFYVKFYQPDNAMLVVGRQVRRGRSAGAGRQIFRPDPQTEAQVRTHLHRRAGSGRRADR